MEDNVLQVQMSVLSEKIFNKYSAEEYIKNPSKLQRDIDIPMWVFEELIMYAVTEGDLNFLRVFTIPIFIWRGMALR